MYVVVIGIPYFYCRVYEVGIGKPYFYCLVYVVGIGKVSKGAKIRNRYTQVPHLTHTSSAMCM